MTNDLRKAAEAATPGPWTHVHYLSGTQNVEFPGSRGVCVVDQVKDAGKIDVATSVHCLPQRHVEVDHRPEDKGREYDEQRHANGRYIALANPQAILTLLDERDALTARVEALEKALKPFVELKPVAWSLKSDMYYINTDDLRRAAAAMEKKP